MNSEKECEKQRGLRITLFTVVLREMFEGEGKTAWVRGVPVLCASVLRIREKNSVVCG